MRKTNNEIVQYKMFNYEKSDVKVDFYMNIEPCETRHRHEYWEIVIAFENGIVNIVNDERIELNEQEILIVRPNDVHQTQGLKKGRAYQYLSIEVREEFFEEILKKVNSVAPARFNAYPKNIPKIKCSVTGYEKILYLMKLSQGYDEADGEKRQFLLKEMLTYILYEYEESFHTKELEEKKDRSFSEEMIKLFNQKENIGLKLHEVCARYPCSVEYAIRRFKIEGLETPNKVFQKIKLGYACLLLKTTDNKVLTICEKIGFYNLGYFNKLFLSTYGVTPREYRNQHRTKK